MKKKIMIYGLLGAPVGATISTAITILVSLLYGGGTYYPVVPKLEAACGSEVLAVTVQFLCAMLYGAACGGLSVIWKIEEWSLLRQTATHLVIFSVITLPVAWSMCWMEHSVGGVLGYFALFLLIYFGIWISLYMGTRQKLKKINEKLKER